MAWSLWEALGEDVMRIEQVNALQHELKWANFVTLWQAISIVLGPAQRLQIQAPPSQPSHACSRRLIATCCRSAISKQPPKRAHHGQGGRHEGCAGR
jgi:hypothetical protein